MVRYFIAFLNPPKDKLFLRLILAESMFSFIFYKYPFPIEDWYRDAFLIYITTWTVKTFTITFHTHIFTINRFHCLDCFFPNI